MTIKFLAPASAIAWLEGYLESDRHNDEARAAVAYLKEQLAPSETEAHRPCTCHPADNPPRPCPQKFAYSECVKAARSTVGASSEDAELIRLLHQRYQDSGDATARKAAWRLEELTQAPSSTAASTSTTRDQGAESVHNSGLTPSTPPTTGTRIKSLDEIAEDLDDIAQLDPINRKDLIHKKAEQIRSYMRSTERLMDEAGKFFDWGNEASKALKNLMDAYERRIRSMCNAEEIERQPWRCAEFVVAERVLNAKPNWVIAVPPASLSASGRNDGLTCLCISFPNACPVHRPASTGAT